MLLYHQAYDIYHCVFRMLKILKYSAGKALEYDRLSILDFYLLFPHLIKDISVPQELVSEKTKFKRYASKYDFNGDPKFFFSRLRALQETALRVLVAKKIIAKEGFEDKKLNLNLDEIPSDMRKEIDKSITEYSEVLSFLIDKLDVIELTGARGLKQRTGLLEYRYDDNA
jgi:hypothetical protein